MPDMHARQRCMQPAESSIELRRQTRWRHVGYTWRDADGQLTSADVYGIANLHYEFLDDTTVDVAGTSFANANDRLWGSIGGGGSYSWHSNKYSIYGDVSYNTSLSNIGVNDSYKGIGGFRIVW
jgi:outer membrane autotransporter protein